MGEWVDGMRTFFIQRLSVENLLILPHVSLGHKTRVEQVSSVLMAHFRGISIIMLYVVHEFAFALRKEADFRFDQLRQRAVWRAKDWGTAIKTLRYGQPERLVPQYREQQTS